MRKYAFVKKYVYLDSFDGYVLKKVMLHEIEGECLLYFIILLKIQDAMMIFCLNL